MRFVNIVPVFPENVDYMVSEAKRLYEECGIDEPTLCMTLHPEAAPYCGEMLKELRAAHGGIPLCHIQYPRGAAYTPGLESAGARKLCTLAAGTSIWEF